MSSIYKIRLMIKKIHNVYGILLHIYSTGFENSKYICFIIIWIKKIYVSLIKDIIFLC